MGVGCMNGGSAILAAEVVAAKNGQETDARCQQLQLLVLTAVILAKEAAKPVQIDQRLHHSTQTSPNGPPAHLDDS